MFKIDAIYCHRYLDFRVILVDFNIILNCPFIPRQIKFPRIFNKNKTVRDPIIFILLEIIRLKIKFIKKIFKKDEYIFFVNNC